MEVDEGIVNSRNPVNIKGLHNSVVGDVEETRHVTLTVHKVILDGGRCGRFVCMGRRF